MVRKPDVPTSISVLPIRPNGERPSLHLLGANLAYTLDDIDWAAVAAQDHLHLGGTEMLGSDFATRVLRHAKENGVTTSLDLIAPGGMGTFDLIAPALAYTDYLLPNEEQVLGFTGAEDLDDGCRRLLDAGAGLLAVTCGADGSSVVSPEGTEQVPAFGVDAVDTTGCGDAFSAGFVCGVHLGRQRRSSQANWAATTANSTSPPPTRSRRSRHSPRIARVASDNRGARVRCETHLAHDDLAKPQRRTDEPVVSNDV